AKWGDYVVAAGIDTKVQYIDDTKGAGENFGDLCVTTAPTGATAGNTADLKARFVFPYRDHLVLANITPVSDYPASNTIYSANTNYGSLVWLSMSDNIRRYASPVAHPEVKGSLPMNLVDGVGSITGAIGGEDAYVFKQNCIFKLTGPPFDMIP